MEIGEKERSILYPEAKINFATLLCTFIDLEFPNETVKIKISFEKAVELIEEHEEKFERGYSEILKKYIIGGFLDYGYICLKKYEEKGIENVGSISKIIDTLEIQYHR